MPAPIDWEKGTPEALAAAVEQYQAEIRASAPNRKTTMSMPHTCKCGICQQPMAGDALLLDMMTSPMPDKGPGYPSGLTASAFELLIRAYWSPTAFADWVQDGGGDARTELLNAELAGLDRRLTERGLAMARHVLNTPLPRSVWVIS